MAAHTFNLSETGLVSGKTGLFTDVMIGSERVRVVMGTQAPLSNRFSVDLENEGQCWEFNGNKYARPKWVVSTGFTGMLGGL